MRVVDQIIEKLSAADSQKRVALVKCALDQKVSAKKTCSSHDAFGGMNHEGR